MNLQFQGYAYFTSTNCYQQKLMRLKIIENTLNVPTDADLQRVKNWPVSICAQYIGIKGISRMQKHITS